MFLGYNIIEKIIQGERLIWKYQEYQKIKTKNLDA